MTSTQTVTFLFTDIVGSTEMSSRMGPDEADRLRQSHFSLLRQALSAGDGTEVKNLGDGIMAVFGSPSSAVACAVAMQQGIEQDNRRSPHPLGLRVGLSCGETTVEGGDYFGDPVVEAARICGLSEGGQILASEAVRAMAGRRCTHPFGVIGERELKGLPDPVTLWDVGWSPATTTAGIPLPDRLESTSTSLFGFFGRQQEKGRLLEAVKNASEGTHLVALLAGEPGIGKTSLCKEVAKATYELGIPVLYGHCDEDLVVSYQPFAEALTHLVVHAEDSLLTEHVEDSGAVLSTLVPALTKRLPEKPGTDNPDPDAERLRLFAAVVNLLSIASSDRGLLLVLDDLHWADKASLQLLRHVTSSMQLPKVMVMGTYRPSDLHSGSALSDTLASLRRESSAVRIDLVGLDDLEIVEMMEVFAEHKMDQDGIDLGHAIRQETEGNPFFATELLRHLGESGLVYQNEAGRWVASQDLYEKGLPQSVREVVGQRVDRLGEEMRRVLSQAAVIGRDFDAKVLAAVAESDEDGLLDVIDRGVQAGLLVEVEGTVEYFSFAHGLTQHTLYEDLGATRRARAHRKIAEVLEELSGATPETRAAELARHFVAATKAADATKALTYSKLAGEQALAHLAPADALGWFSQALELFPQVPPDERLRCDLLIGLGTAQRRTGDPAHRQILLDAAAIAAILGDRDRLVAAALANSRGGFSAAGQVDHQKSAVLEQALDAVGPGDSPERARLLAILGAELYWGADRDRRSALFDESLAIARRLDDPLCLLQVLPDVYRNDLVPDSVENRLADFGLAISLADEYGDLKSGYAANYQRALTCLQAADSAGFDSHLDAAAALAARMDEPFESWSTMTLRSMRSLLLGDIARSTREAESALALAGQSVPEAMSTYGAQLLAVYRIEGEWTALAEMTELIAAAAADNPGLPVLRTTLARSYCDLARDEEAGAVIDDDISNGYGHFRYDAAWISSMATLSEICVHLDRADGAAVLYDCLRPWDAQVSISNVTSQGPVAFHAGCLATLLDRFDQAEGHFTQALKVAQKLDAPYWIARTQIAWAKLDRQTGSTHTGRAETMVADALRAAEQHGFGALFEENDRVQT
jgi:class 3 adenylate cyclase/DNA polymerase III delta prime subunit